MNAETEIACEDVHLRLGARECEGPDGRVLRRVHEQHPIGTTEQIGVFADVVQVVVVVQLPHDLLGVVHDAQMPVVIRRVRWQWWRSSIVVIAAAMNTCSLVGLASSWRTPGRAEREPRCELGRRDDHVPTWRTHLRRWPCGSTAVAADASRV